MRWEIHRTADMAPSEQEALGRLSLAVYPPEIDWPGRAIHWAAPDWSVVAWQDDGEALCHIGIFFRDGRWNERLVKIGGIGGVKTHPAARKQGLASAGMKRAVDFFGQQGSVDFGLLVCEAALVPFYERLGWRRFPGELLVTQKGATVPFTFNLPMTIPIRLREELDGTIDLCGPPW